MANPCFPSQIKEFPFTQDEIADVWSLANEHYIDKGITDLHEIISGMSRDLGMRKEHIAQAITSNKATRAIDAGARERTQRRQSVVSQARQYLKGLVRQERAESGDAGSIRAIAMEHVDAGKSLKETLDMVSKQTGKPPSEVAAAIARTESKNISNDVWKALNKRREASMAARQIVESMNDSVFKQKLKEAYDLPRAALTFGHGGVFPVTHMGQYMFIPSRWRTFLKTSTNAWKFMSDKQYAIAIERHLADPYYNIARRASKSVDPEQQTVGILKNMRGWTGRGFNSLKIARLDLFKKEFSQLPKEEQTLENAKPIMSVIDAATGEVNLGSLGKYLSKMFFAPKLMPARFKSAIVDPYRAINTYANWKEASAGERQAARIVLKQQAQTIAFYGAAMVLNEGVNQMVGSNNHVNFTDPKKGDWLAFKIAGLTIRPPNALLEVLRLAGGIVAPFVATRKELRGAQPEQVAGYRVADYLRYKLHPTFRLGSELASGVDLFGRPLPFPGVRQLATGEKAKSTPAKPQIELPEYLLGKGPIPLGGGVREFYDVLREEGMNHVQAKDWIRTAAVMAIEAMNRARAKDWIRAAAVTAIEGTGIPAHETPKPKQSKRYSAFSK